MKSFRFLILFFFILVNSYVHSFEFALLGDNRPSYGVYSPTDTYKKIINQIVANTKIKFIINSGDIISGYTKNIKAIELEWDGFFDHYEKIKIPYHIALGNHDIFNNQYSLAYYLKKVNRRKSYYSFDYENTHFIILNTEEIGYKHQLSDKQYNWLKNDLEKNKDKLIFVVGHEPIFPAGEHIGSSLDYNKNFQKKFFNLLRKYHVYAYLCGHEHILNINNFDGVYQFISGGAGAPLRTPEKYGGFFHYIIFNVEKKKVNYKIVKISTTKYPFRRYVNKDIYLEYNFYVNSPEKLTLYYRLDKSGKYFHKNMKKRDSSFFIRIKKFDVKKIYVYFKDNKGHIYRYNNRDFKVWIK